MHKTIKVHISDISVLISSFHPKTEELFADYTENYSGTGEGLRVPNRLWGEWDKIGRKDDQYGEGNLLTAVLSEYMLNYSRCIIHAAAVSFRGRAWLFAAPPGVGKSTQVRSLQKLYPGEFGVICGDRPVLELQADGTVMVHPSPWNGKENWHGAEKAPLAGILCLKRGKETSIRRWTKAEAVIPVYMSLISSRETEELIRQLSAFETELLTRVPVYEYVNGGVPDSARYLYENLLDGGRLEGEV